jgi:hypothetical protein
VGVQVGGAAHAEGGGSARERERERGGEVGCSHTPRERRLPHEPRRRAVSTRGGAAAEHGAAGGCGRSEGRHGVHLRQQGLAVREGGAAAGGRAQACGRRRGLREGRGWPGRVPLQLRVAVRGQHESGHCGGGGFRGAGVRGRGWLRRGRLAAALRLRYTAPLQTARTSNGWLGTALVLAAPASTMRDAVRCATSNSCLGAAFVLAAPASAMRDAGACIASGRLGAALVLAAPATAVRDTVERAA